MKKIFALFLAAVLTAQMLVPAWAEGTAAAPAEETTASQEESEATPPAPAAEDPAEGPEEDPEENPEDPEEDSEEDSEENPGEAQPVRVRFACTPEDLTLVVYPADGDVVEMLDPETDGSYLLLPGEYGYLAAAEGYAAEEGSFTVNETKETNVEITLAEALDAGDMLADGDIPSSTPDSMPPVLEDISFSVDTVVVPGSVEIIIGASDDVSGVSSAEVYLKNEEEEKEYSAYLYKGYAEETGEDYKFILYPDGKLHGTLELDEFAALGVYRISRIYLQDRAGNSCYYYPQKWGEDTKTWKRLPEQFANLTITATNTPKPDVEPPILKNITLAATEITAPGKLEVVMDAEDAISGLDSASIYFSNEQREDDISCSLLSTFWDNESQTRKEYPDGKFHGWVWMNEYTVLGEYHINRVQITDAAGNSVSYSRTYTGEDTKSYKSLPEQFRDISFTVTDSPKPDNEPPVLKDITLSADTVATPGFLDITVDAADAISGPKNAYLSFYNEQEEREYSCWLQADYFDYGLSDDVKYSDGKLHGTLRLDQYTPLGVYKLSRVDLADYAGNSVNLYSANWPENLKNLQFTAVSNSVDIVTSVSKPGFVDEIAAAEDGANISADFSGNETLPKEAFDAIRGTDKTLNLTSDGITWQFEGKDIQKESKPIGLGVRITAIDDDPSPAAQEILKTLDKNAMALVMQFPENGDLPGKATVQVKIDYNLRNYLRMDRDLSIYYFNRETGELELIAENVYIAGSGNYKDDYVSFSITHCSYYVLVSNPPESASNRLFLHGYMATYGVYLNGCALPVQRTSIAEEYVEIPEDAPPFLTTYTYLQSDDPHTSYPTGMEVYQIVRNRTSMDWGYVVENLLNYAGTSIRITGKKGIRMITAVDSGVKDFLINEGLEGYKLTEYGTVLARANAISGDLTLKNGKSNYAYKRGVADPVFAYAGNMVQYTNVLVGFTNEDCKEDILMRPYMKLQNESGDEVVLYGGTVARSIGYVAYQNRNSFQPGTAAYDYVWEIIHNVYGTQYDSEYKG